jgi:deoxyribonuclease-4
MIWLGPAGVGIGSKDRSSLGGIKYVAEIKLNAMELEFVRGVHMGLDVAKEVGELAKQLGVRLSIHAPYFINLCSEEKEKVEASKKRISDSIERARAMHADIVVFHPGYYGKLTKGEAYRRVKEACEELTNKDVRLGLETTGKWSQFGSVEEIIGMCKDVKNCSIVIDFAHLYARSGGKIDYSAIFDEIMKIRPKHLHTHFSNIEFTVKDGKGNERRHIPIENNRPPFELLAKEIMKRKIDITIISESPVLEQDSLIMKRTFEKLGQKF